ncbi:MAG: hypothetical protein EBU73_06525 [Chitinophagia bacterium]|jgi:hypothetical protein|nr:hypothetical protein [Chitinophagia bacterium]
MKIEDTIKEILGILATSDSQENAKAYGITVNEDGLQIKDIAQNADVYMLIDELIDDKRLANVSFNYFCLLTTGWAAPLDENGEVSGAPSKHPERRRVSLLVTADMNDKTNIISAIKFHGDDDDEIVFDYNQATGSLAEAINDLLS